MKLLSPAKALSSLRGDERIVSSPGCGSPTALLGALADRAHEVTGLKLYSGLLLGPHPFIPAVESGHLSYATWHVTRKVRNLVNRGVSDYFPIRASEVTNFIEHLEPDVALIRVSPPDSRGYCNLGPSVSYPPALVASAKQVIAEVDDTLPRPLGDGQIHATSIDLFVESTSGYPVHKRSDPDRPSRDIADYILNLLPEQPVLQIGLGSIPEALVARLQERSVGGLRFAGMAVDGIVDIAERDLLSAKAADSLPPVLAAELMGTERLMQFANENSAVLMRAAPIAINGKWLSRMDRFVSVNSAVEVDLYGQASLEWVAGRQISGTGGSADFVEAANHSAGGVRIIAMMSTNPRDSSSKIVRELAAGTPVTLPRHSVEFVVTEYGVADLRYASIGERAERLIAIAHPDHRDALSSE